MRLSIVANWFIDERRKKQLSPIAKEFNKSIPEIVDLAVDEFIANHPVPAESKPPIETQKDKFHRRRIEELASGSQESVAGVRRNIMGRLPADELQRKYAIDSRALPGFQDYIKRTE
jgi:hypothetical protein